MTVVVLDLRPAVFPVTRMVPVAVVMMMPVVVVMAVCVPMAVGVGRVAQMRVIEVQPPRPMRSIAVMLVRAMDVRRHDHEAEHDGQGAAAQGDQLAHGGNIYASPLGAKPARIHRKGRDALNRTRNRESVSTRRSGWGPASPDRATPR